MVAMFQQGQGEPTGPRHLSCLELVRAGGAVSKSQDNWDLLPSCSAGSLIGG